MIKTTTTTTTVAFYSPIQIILIHCTNTTNNRCIHAVDGARPSLSERFRTTLNYIVSTTTTTTSLSEIVFRRWEWPVPASSALAEFPTPPTVVNIIIVSTKSTFFERGRRFWRRMGGVVHSVEEFRERAKHDVVVWGSLLWKSRVSRESILVRRFPGRTSAFGGVGG